MTDPEGAQSYDALCAENQSLRQRIVALEQQLETTTQELHLFRALADNSPDGVGFGTLDGVLTYVNQAYCQMAQMDELPDPLTIEHVYADHPELVLDMYEQTREHGSWHGVLDFKRQDGTTFKGELSANIICDHVTSEPCAISGILRDVTETLELRESLQRSQNLIQAFIDHSTSVLFVKDLDGNFLLASHHLASLLHMNPTQMCDQNQTDLFPPDMVVAWEEEDRQILETGAALEVEELAPLEDGTHTIITTKFPIYDARGAAYAIGGISIDITARKRTEQALAESEQIFRSFFEQSKDGLVLTNSEGNVIAWNAGAEELTGITRDEVLGKPVWDAQFQIVPAEYRTNEVYEKTRDQTRAFLETGEVPGLGQWIGQDIERSDRTRRSVHFLTFPIETSYGRLLGSITRDITELVQLDALREEIERRRRVEQELRHSEARYRLLVETSPDAIVLFDMEHNVSFCNQRAAEMHGYDNPDDLIGTNMRALMADTEQQEVVENYHHILRTGSSSNFERTLVRRDGSTFPAEISTSFIPDDQQNPSAFLGIARDITERKQAEQKLRESDQRLRTLVNAAPVAILIWRGDTLYYGNTAAETLFGYTQQELQSQSLEQLIHPDSQALIRAQGEQRYLGKHIEERYGLPIVTNQGTMRWVDMVATTVGTDEHAFLLVLALDKTRQKQADDAQAEAYKRLEQTNAILQHNRDVLRTIFDNINDGLVLIDHNGMVQATNRMMSKLLVKPFAALVNQPWATLCSTNKDEMAHDMATGFPGLWALETLHNGRSQNRRFRCRCLDDNNIRTLDMKTIPLALNNETTSSYPAIEHMILHIVDVSENLRANALQIENERLLTTQQINNIVAHELRNLLQIVRANLELFQEDSEDQREHSLETIYEETVRACSIVESLRDVYHKPSAPKTMVNVNQMVEHVRELTSGVLSKQHIAFDCHLSPDPPYIYSRTDELIMVLFNLVFNAMVFMPGGGTLCVTTTLEPPQDQDQDQDRVCITVSDTGTGIPEEIREHVFEPFFTTREDGMGVGLFVCKQFVTNHNGTIHVESQLGAGTTFVIRIPVYTP